MSQFARSICVKLEEVNTNYTFLFVHFNIYLQIDSQNKTKLISLVLQI